VAENLRVCGTRTINGDCLFHRWMDVDGKVVGLVETKGGGLIELPWKWIYFYDSEKYFDEVYVDEHTEETI
jgi:hypothetical protein